MKWYFVLHIPQIVARWRAMIVLADARRGMVLRSSRSTRRVEQKVLDGSITTYDKAAQQVALIGHDDE